MDRFFWDKALVLFLTDLPLEAAARISPERLNADARVLRACFLEGRNAATDDQARVLSEFLHLRTCLWPIEYGIVTGRLLLTHEWLVKSLLLRGGEPANNQEVQTGDFLALWGRLFSITEPAMQREAVDTLTRWVGGLYYYSQRWGGLVDLAAELAAVSLALVRGRLRAEVAVEPACHLAAWLTIHRQEAAKSLVVDLEKLLVEKKLDRRLLKQVAILLTASPGTLTTTPIEQRAQAALTEFSEDLVGHERLQLLVASCPTVESLVAARQDLIETITELRKEIREELPDSSPTAEHYALGRLDDVWAPARWKLAAGGECDQAMALLALWRGVDGARPGANGLWILLSHPDGPWYATEGASHTPSGDHVDYRNLVAAMNRALGTSIAVRNDPSFCLVPPPNPIGKPDPGASREFEVAALGRLDLAQASEWISDQDDIQFILPLPGGQVPLQALMLRELGFTRPIAQSLQKPAPDATIADAIVVVGDSFFSQVEADAVTAILESVGISVNKTEITDLADLRKAYEDPSADLIWMAAHGEWEHYQPHLSYIHVRSTLHLDVTELLSWAVPERPTRRLLVLNACDSGNAALLGGPADLGLGGCASNSCQAVIGHLWPVEGIAALAFGMLLARNLGNASTFFEAFSDTVIGLPQVGRGALENSDREEVQIAHERILNRQDPWQSFLNCASAVFIE